MATVRTPVAGWSGVRAGVSFARGVGETDDPSALAYFRRRGYKVDADEPADKPLEKRTVAELKAYATEHTIDLGDATKKPDILAAIELANEAESSNGSDA